MNPAEQDSFLSRSVPAFSKRVFRLGLSASFGLSPAGVREALEGPVNYFFWNPMYKAVTATAREIIAKNRERYVVATGPMLGYFGGSVRRATDRALSKLGSDYIDVLQLFWAGKMSFLTAATMRELVELKEKGKVRAIGVSIHDRKWAGRLAQESPLDLLMIRYNAAHPGAETDIFPFLEKRKPAVVAYTATCWRKLLRRPKEWTGPVPSAGDCYRFCLTNPNVDVVLCGPRNPEELRENLTALEKGPLSKQEITWMRDFGRVVHG